MSEDPKRQPAAANSWLVRAAERLMGPGGFALAMAGFLGLALLVFVVSDPFEVARLQEELRISKLIRFQRQLSAEGEIRGLQSSVLNLQQGLTDLQNELASTQEALRAARAANDAMIRDGINPLPVTPAAPSASSLPRAPVAPVDPMAQARQLLVGLRDALTQNARDYLNLSNALAEARKALALAKGQAKPETAAIEFLSAEERGERTAAEVEANAVYGPMPALRQDVEHETVQLNRALAAAQRRLGAGQRELGAVQDAIRAVRAP